MLGQIRIHFPPEVDPLIRIRSSDPDPHQNEVDPKQCFEPAGREGGQS